jgi:putative NADH-flavin reductase
MKVILFGATGMVGQGVLRECLIDADVREVLAIGRSPIGQTHPKLRELVRQDLLDLSPVEAELSGFDACFFCLGVSSAGMREEDYRRVTYDLTLAVGRTLARLNPDDSFTSRGRGPTPERAPHVARVKGQTENALLALRSSP